MKNLFLYVIVFLSALLLSGCTTPFMIWVARRFGVLDVPDGKLKRQKAAIPYLGGVAIFVSFFIPFFFLFPFDFSLLLFFLGEAVLLSVGLIDDFNTITPLQKICGQVVAVICFLFGGFYIEFGLISPLVDYLFSGFWMLTVINAFNLVDVMDGLASCLALVSSISFAVLSIYLGFLFQSYLSIIFAGAIAGFCFFNKPPAKIYLGDAGSLFIGGFFAVFSVSFPWTRLLEQVHDIGHYLFLKSFFVFMLLFVFLAVPLLELFSLIVIRWQKGLPFYFGSPHHFFCYLSKKRWSVVKILLFAVSMSFMFSLLGITFLLGLISLFGFVTGVLVFLGVWFKVVFD